MNEINDHRENNTIKLSSDDRDKGNDKDHTLQYLRSPTIQNLNDLLLSCVKKDEYCYSMIDYFKKMFNFRQVDYYLAYIQLIYCFQPKEITKMAKNRKRKSINYMTIITNNRPKEQMGQRRSRLSANPHHQSLLFFNGFLIVLSKAKPFPRLRSLLHSDLSCPFHLRDYRFCNKQIRHRQLLQK